MQGHGPFIQSLVDKVCDRLEHEVAGKGKPVVLNDVYGALTGDIIMNLAFAKSYDFIAAKNWESPFTMAINNLVTTSHYTTHFSWIVPAMNRDPGQAAHGAIFQAQANHRISKSASLKNEM